ncbi:uncharacterized protein J7T54_007486 [Emericellopsis cladophorae]|uniref:Uncharacterized protein n=1 Tax=Emericellopsis cladophorae TaxID=2686198 RepID=A0A9P9XYE8_9HYPO|nr:uncharacterized protein J7T54_007486 [Emericellopsis cladophorae]KAI6780010.1 hypothetical protein J7T54_007486 [Emericellopsis cladophorae]
MDSPGQCTGSPTFNLAVTNSAFSEWPENLPGLVCKTPPMGYYHAARFAECCSGTVHNITTPTSPDDPAYPVTCALLCQVDPKLDEHNDRYPYGFSEHFMCLADGRVGLPEEESNPRGAPGGEVVCATLTVTGVEAPTSYPNSWTGDWQTRSYYRLGPGNLSWSWRYQYTYNQNRGHIYQAVTKYTLDGNGPQFTDWGQCRRVSSNDGNAWRDPIGDDRR